MTPVNEVKAVKLTKAQADRLWVLRRWENHGWMIDVVSGKRREAQREALVKQGLLEADGEGRARMYRITDAGRAALQQSGGDQT